MTRNLSKRGGFSLFKKKEMEPSKQITNVKDLVMSILHHDSFQEYRGYKGRTQHTAKEFYPRYYVDNEKNNGKQYVYSGLVQKKDEEGKPTGNYYLNFNEVYRNSAGNTDYSEIGFNKNKKQPQHIYLDTDDKDSAENADISDKKIFVTDDSMQFHEEIVAHNEKENEKPQYAILRYYGGKKRSTKKRKSMKKKQRKTKRRKSLKQRKSRR